MNSFLIFQNGQPQQTGSRQKMQEQLARYIMGQPAQNTAQGVGQLAAGIGMGLRNFQNNSQFPTAPGGQTPSIGTSLANLFTFNKNGGLY